MGIETWVCHYESASKCQSMEWEHTSLPRTKKFKSVSFPGKMLLMLFWDLTGPILQQYHDCGQTVSSAQYCASLEEELKHTIDSKFRRMLANRVVLHHDNARPHMATANIEMI
jgi:hypothetical protein